MEPECVQSAVACPVNIATVRHHPASTEWGSLVQWQVPPHSRHLGTSNDLELSSTPTTVRSFRGVSLSIIVAVLL